MFDEPEWEDSDDGSSTATATATTTTIVTTETVKETSNSDSSTTVTETKESTDDAVESKSPEPETVGVPSAVSDEGPVPSKKIKLDSAEEEAPVKRVRCKEPCCTCGDCHQIMDMFHLLHIMFPKDRSVIMKALAYNSSEDDDASTDTNATYERIRAAFRILTRISIFETLPVGTRYIFASEPSREKAGESEEKLGKKRDTYKLEKALALGIGKAIGLELRTEETDAHERVVGYVPQAEVHLFDRRRVSKSLLRVAVSMASSVALSSPITRDSLTQQLVSAAERNDVESALAAIATAQMFDIGLNNPVIKGPSKVWPCNSGTKWCSFKETYLNDDYRTATYLESIPNCEFNVLYDGSFKPSNKGEIDNSKLSVQSGFSSLIYSFASKIGMTPVSSVVQVEVIAPKQKEDNLVEFFLSRHSESIQRYLMFTHPETYFALTNSASPFSAQFTYRLGRLKIVRCTPSLQVKFSLRASSMTSSRSRQVTPPAPCVSVRVDETIYFWGVVPKPAVPAALFAEISRLFSPVGLHNAGLSALLADLSGGDSSPAALAALPPLPSINEVVWRPCIKSSPYFKDGCELSVVNFVAPVESMEPTHALLGDNVAKSHVPLYDVTVYTIRNGAQKIKLEGKIHNEENQWIGRVGEEVAYKFLCEQFAGTGSKVTWPNEVVDGGLPYDLFVTHPGGEVHYYEVKSTSSSLNISFPVTSMELDFAKRHRKNFHILRVLRVGKPDVTVVKLTNPYQMARQRNVHIWFEIDTEKRDF